jgi:cell division transport system permease protein
VLGRLAYVLRETWASFRRNVTLTLAAIITSAVALLIFGLTLFVQKGFDNTVARWEGGVEMIAVVTPGASVDQLATIEDTLARQSTVIDEFTYCNVDCSLTEADRLFANDPNTRALITAENIPTQFKIVPVDAVNADELEALQSTLVQLPSMRGVIYPDDVIEVISRVKDSIGLYTLILSIVLLLAAILLIWNTIRTAMFARRREIEVMKLVGATDWFIRVPFMLEGLIQGLVGALGACGALWIINNRWTSQIRGFESLEADSGLSAMTVGGGFQARTMLAILIIGMAAGAIGSGIAASRFLDV